MEIFISYGYFLYLKINHVISAITALFYFLFTFNLILKQKLSGSEFHPDVNITALAYFLLK